MIDKVGSLLGRTQGASKDAGLASYKTALKLNPSSAIAMVEYANGLVMLEGDKRMKEATKLYEDAAQGRAAGCHGAARCRDGEGGAGGLRFWLGVGGGSGVPRSRAVARGRACGPAPLRCSVAGPPQNSLRSLRSLRSSMLRQVS